MSVEALKPLLARGATGVHEGELLARTGEGWKVKVDAPLGIVLECVHLQMGALPVEFAAGDRVVVLLGEAGCAYLLGRLGESDRRATLRGERILIEADAEVVLRTRRSSLRLGAEGDVELRAGRIVSRASRVQRLLAPLLRLN